MLTISLPTPAVRDGPKRVPETNTIVWILTSFNLVAKRQPCSTLHVFTMIQWSPSHGSYCLQSRIVNNGVLTFLAGIQFCHDIAINPTSQHFLWIGGSRPPDPRLPQASSTGPPPAIAQFKRGAKTVGQCAGVVI